VRVLDPTSLLCGPQECPMLRERVALYADDDHISATAAKSIVSRFEPDLEWLFEHRPEQSVPKEVSQGHVEL
jgi:hypothetical protein